MCCIKLILSSIIIVPFSAFSKFYNSFFCSYPFPVCLLSVVSSDIPVVVYFYVNIIYRPTIFDYRFVCMYIQMDLLLNTIGSKIVIHLLLINLQLVMVKESTTCEYEALILTKQLCLNEAYGYNIIIMQCQDFNVFFFN